MAIASAKERGGAASVSAVEKGKIRWLTRGWRSVVHSCAEGEGHEASRPLAWGSEGHR
jgi:hypothetical protein